MEMLLEHGTIVDGSGMPSQTGSLLLRDGKIREIFHDGADVASVPRVDCTGLTVAPGFVDVHSHGDYEVIEGLPNKVLQGVTTEIVGNCSYSLYPMTPAQDLQQLGSIYADVPPFTLRSAHDYLAKLEATQPLLNVASLTGHSALRTNCMGMDRRPPSVEELSSMERMLDQSLNEGSIGFSTGLNLMPSSFGEFDELLSLCRVVKRHNAYYATHMRDYKFRALQAVEEALRLAEESGAAVQLSHVQVVGKKCWASLDAILEVVGQAAQRGVNVGMDAYPYMAGSCSLIQLLPEWCQAGGIKGLLERLESPSLRDRIARETDEYMPNTWADIIISGGSNQMSDDVLGKSVEQIGASRDRLPRDTALDLLRQHEGQVNIISFNNCEENLRKVLTHPLTSICTDGHVSEGLSHPRTFGTYPTFLGKYVREARWMTLEEAIVKTSAMPAQRFQLTGRGTIAKGNWADLVVFDASSIMTQSDYASPNEPPEGIRLVIVNGQIVAENGKLTGVRSGATLRHSASGAV